MNLSFLSPIYLLGILGIAGPVLIHLLTRRQQKKIRFSATYLLFQSQKRSIKKSRPNRLLLLFIRGLGILLLSLALAHPLFSMGAAESFLPESPSSTVFIIDDSYSMSMRAGAGSVFDGAVETALNALKQLPPESSVSLLTGSAPARILLDWTKDRAKAGKILKAAEVSYLTTNMAAAISKGAEHLELAPNERKRIYIFTDLDKNGWKTGEASKLKNRLDFPVKIFDFSDAATGPNSAVLQQTEVNQQFLINNRVIRVKSKITNLSRDKPLVRLPIEIKVEGKKLTGGFVDIPAGGAVEKELSFPHLSDKPILGTVEIGEDALERDNRRFFTHQPDQTIKVLLVDGDPKTVEHQSESFYVENALNPFAAALSNIRPTVSTLEELERRNLFDFSVIMLCNIRELPPDYELKLEKFVSSGGALFISLGDQVNPRFYNEVLGNLLPVALQSLQQVQETDEPFRLLLKENKHKTLRIFTTKTLAEMREIRFNSLYSIEPKEDREFKVPLWFSNKFPAVVESALGKGKVILYVSSIDRDWNNFPIQPTFLPWIQRWVQYSAKSLESIIQQNLRVGEPFVQKDDLSGDVMLVQTPGGKVSPLKFEDGESVFKATFRPGVYRLYRHSGPNKSLEKENASPAFKIPPDALRAGAFTVNIDTNESIPGKITPNEIQNQFAGIPFEFSKGNESEGIRERGPAVPLATPALLLLAGIFLWEGWTLRND